MPGVEHRFYVKHMYKKFKVLLNGADHKKWMWGAAAATTKKTWEAEMQKLKELDQKTYEWVMKHDPNT